MNQKQKRILKLCADQPKTARRLVEETGETANVIRFNLHALVKLGAMTYEVIDDAYGTRLYKADPHWKPPTPENKSGYKPLGLCVFGVWM